MPNGAHPDPEQYVTGAFVKVGFFREGMDLVYQDEVHGNLFQQIVKLMDLLCTKYMKAIITYEGIQRIETLPIPREALREALLNACINKDYAEHSPIQIRVYENKLEIINGDVLPEGWTVETLLSSHRSMPYNPDIANTFFRAGEIEAWGRGIERIIMACKNDGFSTPGKGNYTERPENYPKDYPKGHTKSDGTTTSYTVILKRTSGSDPKRNQRESFRHYRGWCKVQSFSPSRAWLTETYRR